MKGIPTSFTLTERNNMSTIQYAYLLYGVKIHINKDNGPKENKCTCNVQTFGCQCTTIFATNYLDKYYQKGVFKQYQCSVEWLGDEYHDEHEQPFLIAWLIKTDAYDRGGRMIDAFPSDLDIKEFNSRLQKVVEELGTDVVTFDPTPSFYLVQHTY